jgi:hypothetical protein
MLNPTTNRVTPSLVAVRVKPPSRMAKSKTLIIKPEKRTRRHKSGNLSIVISFVLLNVNCQPILIL